MENNNFIKNIITEGIKAIKKNKESDTESDITKKTKKTLINLKKEFAKNYVNKNINNTFLQTTGIAEDYLINEGIGDKLKDKLIYENLLKKSDLDTNLVNDIIKIRSELEDIKTESKLMALESTIFKIKKPIEQKPNTILKEEKKIVNNPDTKNIEQLKINIESELNKYNNCPLTADMIIKAATEYNVPIEYIMAIMRNDSSYGTKGKGARTYNPGNVGNTDDGSTKNRSTREKGVEAVAKNLARRTDEYQKIYGNKNPSIKELATNQGPDNKGFIKNQGNYKKENTKRFGAYMTDERGGNNVQKISDQLAQNISNNENILFA